MLVAVTVGLGTLVVTAPAAVAQDDPYGSTTTTTEAPDTAVSCRVSADRARVGSTVGGQLDGGRSGDRIRLFLGDRLVADVAATGSTTDYGFTVPDMRPGNHTLSAVGATVTAECTVPGGGVRFQVLPATGGGADEDGRVLGAIATPDRAAGAGASGEVSTSVRSRSSLAVTGGQVLALVLFGVALVAAGLVLRNRAQLRRAATHR